MRVLRAVLLAVYLGLGAAQSAPVGTFYGPVPVLAVVDGDTLVLESNLGPRTVRLIGIDAPEMRRPQGGPEPYGIEARAFLEALLPPGTPVWVEVDLAPTDAYGRLLAYLYVADPAGDWLVADATATQVNLAVVEAGWATPLTIAPNETYADLYERAAAASEAGRRGLWAGSPYVTADWPTGPILIWCALVNPSTPNDEAGEWVSVLLRVPLDTRGYYLFDEGSKARFRLPAGVQPAGELRVENPGRGVWNNAGDTIYLMLGDQVVDAWDYTAHVTRVEDVVLCRDGVSPD